MSEKIGRSQEFKGLEPSFDEVVTSKSVEDYLEFDGGRTCTVASYEGPPIYTGPVRECVAIGVYDSVDQKAYGAHFPIESMSRNELVEELDSFTTEVSISSELENLEAVIVGSNKGLSDTDSNELLDLSSMYTDKLVERNGKTGLVNDVIEALAGGQDHVEDRTRGEQKVDFLTVDPYQGFDFMPREDETRDDYIN